jgi:hypothetical protein
MRIASPLRLYARSLWGLRRWLDDTISFAEARARVARRLEMREDSFLRLLRRCVFGNPDSPYLPLLRQASCEYEEIAAGVRRDGIEAELRRLKDAGVWVSLEEFKGRAPIVRGDVELRQTAASFDNPVVSPIVSPGSGGSSGRAVRSLFDLQQLAVKATYDSFMLELGRLSGGVPQAAWYPQLPAVSGTVRSLVYAKLGAPLVRWFDVEHGPRSWPGWQGRLMTTLLVTAARRSGQRLALPEPGPPDAVLDWALRARDRAGRCGLQTYPSRAVRLSQEARRRGQSLEGLMFWVAGEPLTSVRHEEIRASGAEVLAFYPATEAGTIGVGCGDPSEVGETHLCEDLVAVAADGQGDDSSPSVLHLTSLHEATPKVLINTQLGDWARVTRRKCACPLGEMGLDRRLLHLHSIGRVTCEGMTVPVSDLVRIVEEVLRPRYGGSPLDYQWVEQGEGDGKGRVLLRVRPGVGAVECDRVATDVLRELARRSTTGHLLALAWGDAGTLRVVREAPRLTVAGKAPPFVREVADR